MLKYFAIHIVRVLLRVFYIFPINKKKIFFSSFNGKRYFCNPKYIFIDLYEKKSELKYVWCLNKDTHEISKYKNITLVKDKSLLWIFHILTAKVIIVNTHLYSFLPFRKGQIIINTWHGGGAYKTVGFAEFSENAKKNWINIKLRMMFNLSSQNTTYFISSGKVFSDIIHDSLNIAYTKFLPIGMPRNDVFFNNNDILINSLRRNLNISLNFGIVLYAPTYRGAHSYSKSKTIIELDINRLKIALKEKYKKDFVCLFRGHPSFLDELSCDGTVNVSSYNDMQELLLISDVLISDYSSSIWDFSLTFKPCFLFTPDLDLYLSKDRGFYIPIEQWPYTLAKTNNELCNNIANFNQEEYNARVKKHHEDLGSYEQGTATSQMTQLLQKIF